MAGGLTHHAVYNTTLDLSKMHLFLAPKVG